MGRLDLPDKYRHEDDDRTWETDLPTVGNAAQSARLRDKKARYRLDNDLLEQIRSRRPRVRPLSPRELEILTLAREGLSHIEVGSVLGLKRSTVSNYAREAMRKLDARNVGHAVILAIRRGELEIA